MYKKSLSWFFSCISRDSRNCGECENRNNCYEAKLQIQGLVESSREKRTVSEEQLSKWAAKLFDHISIHHVGVNLTKILAKLGYTIEEPKSEEVKP